MQEGVFCKVYDPLLQVSFYLKRHFQLTAVSHTFEWQIVMHAKKEVVEFAFEEFLSAGCSEQNGNV